jgi:hypothetical protein
VFSARTDVLAVSFIPAAGLFLMVWHILVGLKLYRLGGAQVSPHDDAQDQLDQA